MLYNYLDARMIRLGNTNAIIALEKSIWSSLMRIADSEGVSLDELCTYVHDRYPGATWQIALRTYVGERFAAESESPRARDMALDAYLTDAGVQRRVTEKLHPEIITFLHIIAAIENCEMDELLAYVAGRQNGRTAEDTVQHFVARYFYDCAVSGGPQREQLPIRRKRRLRHDPNANDNR